MHTDPDPFPRVPYADRCERCWALNRPVLMDKDGGCADCLYQCRCGYRWQCSWSIGAVEGWGDAA